MKNRSIAAQLFSGLLLTVTALALTACGQVLYKVPQFNFANRPIPPSRLLQRVLASFTTNGTSGGLEILDGMRDIRSNIQNTVPAFFISGYSGGNPTTILNFPEQSLGYIFSTTDGSLAAINYGRETSAGTAATFAPTTPSVAVATDGVRFLGAQELNGQLALSAGGTNYFLNLPNVDKVVINRGDSVILAMVRNSNALYRVIKLNANSAPTFPPGAIDCQPLLLPVYCVVPVPGNYDRPSDVYFSLDGSTAYVLNCGPECGGTTAGITFLQEGALTTDIIPTVNPLSPGAPSPLSILPVANPVPVPGGVTAALSDGSTLYLAGQQLLPNGLFSGTLSTLNLATDTVTGTVSISDGHHSKILFADDQTLWIGAQQCANGQRAALAAQQLAAGGATTQAANTNCLTRVALGATLTAAIVPAVTQGGSKPVPVLYPNTNQNAYYYGSLTGLCWVQNYHKVYTAYGGQIHAFKTADGSEINNTLITVQGTVLDVAYMDAVTNDAD